MATSIAICLTLTAAMSVTPSESVLQAQQARIAEIESFAPAVICVFGRSSAGGGSGVLISPDGYALTNFHVTDGSGDFLRCGLANGKLYDAIVVGVDPTGDVALIKLLGRDDFPHAPLANSDDVRVGDWVYVAGNPFLLASNFQPSVSYGIVSGVHRYQYPAQTFLEYTDCIQYDASLNPGNSGGPLFNSKGEVVGINGRASFEKRGRINVGVGYAISINQIKHFLDHLRSGRIVDHGTIEATVATLPDGTVQFETVLENSDAWRLGLRPGDELVRFAGRPIRSANQFKNVLGIYPRGWTLPLTYRRDGELTQVKLPLRPAHLKSRLYSFSLSHPQPTPKPKKGPKQLIPHEKKKETIPEKLRKLVVERQGFANYRFNRLAQERLLAALAKDVQVKLPKVLVLEGTTSEGKSARFKIADPLVSLNLGGRRYLQMLDGSTGLVDEPPGTGGLLPALHLFTQITSGKTESLAAFYYVGSEPLDGHGPRVEILVGEDRGGRLRLLIGKDSGRLLGFDFRRTENSPRMSVRFGQDRVESDLGTLPKTWHVTHLGKKVFSFNLEQMTKLAEASPKEGA